MDKEYDFDDMRSYTDEETCDALDRITEMPELQEVIRFAFPGKDPADIILLLNQINSVFGFQHLIIAPLITNICRRSKSVVQISGLNQLDRESKYLFISNHRDIIMDAGILNTLLDRNGWETTEVAIGDNLCANQWITDCLRMNKCFLVKRSGTRRELFDAFNKLSTYIRRNICEMANSVWIAQREGRSKDSSDQTQESLLKMLSISAVGDLKQGFTDLNIAPICISYEYDSCDYLKAKEFQLKRDNADYTKTKEDDVLNMKVGILGYKGHIIYEMTPTINEEIENEVDDNDNRIAVLHKVAKIIDHRIHSHYHLFPNNYVALDKLNHTDEHLGNGYTEKERLHFEQYVEKQIEKIDIPNKDIPFLQEKFWLMYANPLINYMKATEQP